MCSCSFSVSWDKLPQFVSRLCHQVVPVRDDGFCFLQAVYLTVCMDQDEDMTLGKLHSSILDHMEANVDYYQKFYTGGILKDVKRYFTFGTYSTSVMVI